jgi:saxitoxin biosynthesis operon SxtJ-like protein
LQWSEAVAPPSTRKLRQFAGLWLAFFAALGLWRMAHGHQGIDGPGLIALAAAVGGLGLLRPGAIRLIYTGWMIAAFPIGWSVSRIMLAGLFYLVFTPVAAVFRLMGRDALRLRRREALGTYWTEHRMAEVQEYFRQF